MDTLQCAIVLAKLPRFDWELGRRQALAARYEARIKELGIPARVVVVRSDRDSVWAQFTIFIDARDAVKKMMDADGIPTAIHYPTPLNRQPAYGRYSDPEACPASREAASKVLSLPMSADLTEQDQDLVIESLRLALARVSK
jgi:UDP-2-acetamido-2-deoxy-ribo-hexuluronate aminotransferase